MLTLPVRLALTRPMAVAVSTATEAHGTLTCVSVLLSVSSATATAVVVGLTNGELGHYPGRGSLTLVTRKGCANERSSDRPFVA